MSLHEDQLRCRFAHTSWHFSGTTQKATPCRTRYHLNCLIVGIPFVTRLPNNKGLVLPPLRDFPGFICEACTVRSVLNRELGKGPKDYALLMLERMRIFDTVNSLAIGTHKAYQQKHTYLRDFEKEFSTAILTCTPIDRPPAPKSISLMWAQQRFSLKVSKWSRRKKGVDEEARVTYATGRALRSAASLFHKLDLMTAFPGQVYLDPNRRVLVSNLVSPTDDLAYTMMNTGMKNRIGEDSNPSKALLDRQVRTCDQSLRNRFASATTRLLQLELARAGLANTLAWLAWTRAKELFDLRWSDLTLSNGDMHDLPASVQVLQLRLNAQTKSDRSRTADIVVAHTTASGMSPGFWVEHIMVLLDLTTDSCLDNDDLIFQHANGQQWSSRFFRTTFLYPSLQQQRTDGDVTLRPFDGSRGNAIADKYYSMHSYRRGARSQCSRKRDGFLRAATKPEVNEHGRWRVSRGSMDMATQYLEWSIADRLSITLLCM
jgi:hypothetical protein